MPNVWIQILKEESKRYALIAIAVLKTVLTPAKPAAKSASTKVDANGDEIKTAGVFPLQGPTSILTESSGSQKELFKEKEPKESATALRLMKDRKNQNQCS